jgi:hypothetical protein
MTGKLDRTFLSVFALAAALAVTAQAGDKPHRVAAQGTLACHELDDIRHLRALLLFDGRNRSGLDAVDKAVAAHSCARFEKDDKIVVTKEVRDLGGMSQFYEVGSPKTLWWAPTGNLSR